MIEKKMKSSRKFMMILAGSTILNILLIVRVLLVDGSNWKPTWSRRAAAEAEAVAAASCSGHGRAYMDGLGVLDGQPPPCECNNCYTGRDCSIVVPDCTADANSGDPLFLEPFWMKHAESSALVVSGWHRMSYRFQDGSFISGELKRLIRRLHKVAGNAITDNRFIIFGAGSTQVLAAAIHALSPTNSSSPARLVASVPYYSLYKEQAEIFESQDFKFEGDASVWKNNTTQIIEIVTSPNNPDGKLRKAILQGPNVKSIHDYAYYWPYFTPVPAPADEEVSLFTISKFTGHAGSRFGWALVKDKAVYERMKRFIDISSIGVSHDTQLRVLHILKAAIGDGGEEIFEFGYETMKNRWEILNRTLSMSRRFSLQKIERGFCSYFKKVRDFTPAYAWLKCERLEDENCYEIFRAAKIIGRRGKVFGAEERFVRLSLIRAQDEFDTLIERLKQLVAPNLLEKKNVMSFAEK